MSESVSVAPPLSPRAAAAYSDFSSVSDNPGADATAAADADLADDGNAADVSEARGVPRDGEHRPRGIAPNEPTSPVVSGERQASDAGRTASAPSTRSAPLTRSIPRVPATSSASSTPRAIATSPTPLAPSTRRFLQPLIGIDPATVRVHRGAVADRLTAAYEADALTAGDEVVVAGGHDERAPATLALLAHELTHVARRRAPRFVPPVLLRDPIEQEGATHGDEKGNARRDGSVLESADEEAIARAVERRVTELAGASAEQVAPEWTGEPPTIAADETLGAGPGSSMADTLIPAPVPARSPLRLPWAAGLPAPWEPLPHVGSPQPPLASERSSSDGWGAGHPSLTTQAGVSGSGEGATSAPAVERAARDRDTAAASPPTAAGAPSAPAAGPAPNVDALARQVYEMVKRRLAAERRRSA